MPSGSSFAHVSAWIALVVPACGPPPECRSLDFSPLAGLADADDGVVGPDDPAIESCERYEGDLAITSVRETTALTIPALQVVTGDLSMSEPYGVGAGSLVFSSLQSVGQDLTIRAILGGLTVEMPELTTINASARLDAGSVRVLAEQEPVEVYAPALSELDNLELGGNTTWNGETDTLTLAGITALRGQGNDRSGLILDSTSHRFIDLEGIQIGGEDTATVYVAASYRLERVDLALAPGSRLDRLILASLPALTGATLTGVDRIEYLSVTDCPLVDPCDVARLMAMADQVATDSQAADCRE